jgi:hypothetical protein
MRTRLTLAAACGVLTLGACASPEAVRVQGGGPGADVGNRRGDLQMHEGSEIYPRTPCLTTLPECTGPLQVGTAPRN